MSKNIYGTLEINGETFRFIFEGNYLRILQDDYHEISQKCFNYLKGDTVDYRNILFLDCELVRRNFCVDFLFSVKGYVISLENVGELYDFKFDRITFYSEALDTFYSPKNAIDRTKSDFGITKQKNDWDGSMSIVLEPFSKTGITFGFENNTYCELNIERWVDIAVNKESLGSLITTFSFVFNEKEGCDNIIKYYVYLYDFLVFMNYNKRICFNKIYLEHKNSDGKYLKKALVVIFNDEMKYEGNIFNTITVDDIPKGKIDAIFKKVTSLRNRTTRFDFYFPENYRERKYMDSNKWLTLAMCFEGLFNESYPNFKQEEKASFKKVKQKILENIETIEIQDFTNKEKKYFDDFKAYIDRNEGVLEEKFNYILKENKTLLSITKEQNYGELFAEFRNKLAHGEKIEFNDDVKEIYNLLRKMVFILLLSDIGLEEQEISNMLLKIFA